MPKASSLTLSLSQEQGDKNTSTLHDGQQSPIRVTGDVGSSGRGESATIPDHVLRENIEPQSSISVLRKALPGGSRTTPKPIPSKMEAPKLHLHPYRSSPGSLIASMSHGNLLETSSITSGSVIESTSEFGESETGFKSNSVPRADGDHTLKTSRKPNKQVFQQILSRSRSIKQENNNNDNNQNMAKLNTRGRLFESSRSRERSAQESPRTAPLELDRSYRDAMEPDISRHRSAERPRNDDGELSRPATSRFANLVTHSTKAAGDIGRAGKGLFGKFSRSGSSNEREGPAIDEHYVIKLINLPLVEQTRKTRIRQRMSDAKDKTEFWLPALPYRCIDYLNLKGCEVEGLYRVPGSVREIKHWQARFDSELDVNLLDVPDLDDVNTIGSLLKAWLRDQPDELIPHSVQKKIAAECADAVSTGQTPQSFKDELSKLPPFNYYLLFAITAHLALLQKHSDINKMDYRNLCICFQPCMSLDPVAFQFLVKDWRNCWQGCWPEKEYLEEEYRIMKGDSEQAIATPTLQGQRDVPSSSQSDQPIRPTKQTSSSSQHDISMRSGTQTSNSARSVPPPKSRKGDPSSSNRTFQSPPSIRLQDDTEASTVDGHKPPTASSDSPALPVTSK